MATLTATRIMGSGVPALTANLIATQLAVDIAATGAPTSAPTRTTTPSASAAGTTIADATPLTGFVNILTTVAVGTGVLLPSGTAVGNIVLVQNDGLNDVTIYPEDVSATINGGSAGAGVTTAAAAGALCFRVSTTGWYVFVLAKEA